MHNFDQIRKEGDLTWLVYGYDGFGNVTITLDAPKIWDEIINEYSELTQNNKTLQYFELVSDSSDMETRIIQVTALLKQLDERPLMDKDIKKRYVEELSGWRFYYNDSKDHIEEVERLKKQLEVVKQKLRLQEKDKESFEGKQDKGDLIELKVLVQNAIKRHIDLRRISVKEWVYTLNNLKKVA